MFISDEEIERRFTYHAPKPGQPEIYQEIRAKAKELAQVIQNKCPDSREAMLALTKLDEVVFHANASIARRS